MNSGGFQVIDVYLNLCLIGLGRIGWWLGSHRAWSDMGSPLKKLVSI
jgi:hypothetical protein